MMPGTCRLHCSSLENEARTSASRLHQRLSKRINSNVTISSPFRFGEGLSVFEAAAPNRPFHLEQTRAEGQET